MHGRQHATGASAETASPTGDTAGTVQELRDAVRAFLAEELATGGFTPSSDCWIQGHSPEFSRKLGERRWLGLTWPRRYGGQERSAFARFVVLEELLAAGAPVAAHWIAERQTGPLLLRFGTEEQCRSFLPGIASGRLFVSAGLSEPDSGSDLASVATRAERVDGGWRVYGRKIWTSHAAGSHWLLTLARTDPRDAHRRHDGLSQLFVDLSASEVEIRPITVTGGSSHFAEVVLDGAFVPDARVVGEVGHGWSQVVSELAYERSGPERFLTAMPLLSELLRSDELDTVHTAELGALVARLWALRALSVRVQGTLASGALPDVEAAMVKDGGTRLEQDIVTFIGQAASIRNAPTDRRLHELLTAAQRAAPTFTLRGGTVEILRGIIAKGLAT